MTITWLSLDPVRWKLRRLGPFYHSSPSLSAKYATFSIHRDPFLSAQSGVRWRQEQLLSRSLSRRWWKSYLLRALSRVRFEACRGFPEQIIQRQPGERERLSYLFDPRPGGCEHSCDWEHQMGSCVRRGGCVGFSDRCFCKSVSCEERESTPEEHPVQGDALVCCLFAQLWMDDCGTKTKWIPLFRFSFLLTSLLFNKYKWWQPVIKRANVCRVNPVISAL